ncbi:MAG: hypothetical protein ACRDJW_07425 [Thermomicrobiales bacterium]
MQEHQPEQSPTYLDDSPRSPRMTALTAAADRLHEEIGALTRAMQGGSAIEKAEARDRFDMALAGFAELIDETRE